jgi:hypothetical protein
MANRSQLQRASFFSPSKAKVLQAKRLAATPIGKGVRDALESRLPPGGGASDVAGMEHTRSTRRETRIKRLRQAILSRVWEPDTIRTLMSMQDGKASPAMLRSLSHGTNMRPNSIAAAMRSEYSKHLKSRRCALG